MEEQKAREQVVRAGLELVSSGLIARTWGNVSCRVDERAFAVTPSGLPYETLTPEKVVLCSTGDGSYSGNIKPSSEKGIHLSIYRAYPEVHFIIHTHQTAASVVGAAGIERMPCAGFNLLGDGVPVAAYGLPGSKRLCRGVLNAMPEAAGGHALLMAHHGALCFGEDYGEAFSAARQLEDACALFLHGQYLEKSGDADFTEKGLYEFYIKAVTGKELSLPPGPAALLKSRRAPDGFEIGGERRRRFRFEDGDIPKEALVHRLIYQHRRDVNFIGHAASGGLFAVSCALSGLRPLLDDFAQIIGRGAPCAASGEPEDIAAALGEKSGVLLPRAGALCCAETESDLSAVSLVMEKNAQAQIGLELFENRRDLGRLDCFLMHRNYMKSYRKLAARA